MGPSYVCWVEPGQVVSCRNDAMYISRTHSKDTRGVFLYGSISYVWWVESGRVVPCHYDTVYS